MVEVRSGGDRARGDRAGGAGLEGTGLEGTGLEGTGLEGTGLAATGLAFQEGSYLSAGSVLFALKHLKLTGELGCQQSLQVIFHVCKPSTYRAFIVCLVLPPALHLAQLLCSGGNSSPSFRDCMFACRLG